MKHLYVFTVNGCVHCETLMNKLFEEKLSFFNLKIEEYEDEFIKLIEATGQDYVPAILIFDVKNQQEQYLVANRDYQSIAECVEVVKTHLKQPS